MDFREVLSFIVLALVPFDQIVVLVAHAIPTGGITLVSNIPDQLAHGDDICVTAQKYILYAQVVVRPPDEITNDFLKIQSRNISAFQQISVNAITASGEKFGKMDDSTIKGMSATACAQKIIAGMQNEKEEILIGGKEIIPIYIKRFFPGLFTWIMKRQKVE